VEITGKQSNLREVSTLMGVVAFWSFLMSFSVLSLAVASVNYPISEPNLAVLFD